LRYIYTLVLAGKVSLITDDLEELLKEYDYTSLDYFDFENYHSEGESDELHYISSLMNSSDTEVFKIKELRMHIPIQEYKVSLYHDDRSSDKSSPELDRYKLCIYFQYHQAKLVEYFQSIAEKVLTLLKSQKDIPLNRIDRKYRDINIFSKLPEFIKVIINNNTIVFDYESNKVISLQDHPLMDNIDPTPVNLFLDLCGYLYITYTPQHRFSRCSINIYAKKIIIYPNTYMKNLSYKSTELDKYL
jgi:hypothetical protein